MGKKAKRKATAAEDEGKSQMTPEEITNPPTHCKPATAKVQAAYNAEKSKSTTHLSTQQELFHVGQKEIPINSLVSGAGTSFLRPSDPRHVQGVLAKLRGKGYDRHLGTMATVVMGGDAPGDQNFENKYLVWDGNHRLAALWQMPKAERASMLDVYSKGDELCVPCNIYQGVPAGLLGVLSATCNEDQLTARTTTDWDLLQFLSGVYCAISKTKSALLGAKKAKPPGVIVSLAEMQAALPLNGPGSKGSKATKEATRKISSNLRHAVAIFNRLGAEYVDYIVKEVTRLCSMDEKLRTALVTRMTTAGKKSMKDFWPSWEPQARLRQTSTSFCPAIYALRTALDAAAPPKAPAQTAKPPGLLASALLEVLEFLYTAYQVDPSKPSQSEVTAMLNAAVQALDIEEAEEKRDSEDFKALYGSAVWWARRKRWADIGSTLAEEEIDLSELGEEDDGYADVERKADNIKYSCILYAWASMPEDLIKQVDKWQKDHPTATSSVNPDMGDSLPKTKLQQNIEKKEAEEDAARALEEEKQKKLEENKQKKLEEDKKKAAAKTKKKASPSKKRKQKASPSKKNKANKKQRGGKEPEGKEDENEGKEGENEGDGKAEQEGEKTVEEQGEPQEEQIDIGGGKQADVAREARDLVLEAAAAIITEAAAATLGTSGQTRSGRNVKPPHKFVPTEEVQSRPTRSPVKAAVKKKKKTKAKLTGPVAGAQILERADENKATLWEDLVETLVKHKDKLQGHPLLDKSHGITAYFRVGPFSDTTLLGTGHNGVQEVFRALLQDDRLEADDDWPNERDAPFFRGIHMALEKRNNLVIVVASASEDIPMRVTPEGNVEGSPYVSAPAAVAAAAAAAGARCVWSFSWTCHTTAKTDIISFWQRGDPDYGNCAEVAQKDASIRTTPPPCDLDVGFFDRGLPVHVCSGSRIAADYPKGYEGLSLALLVAETYKLLRPNFPVELPRVLLPLGGSLPSYFGYALKIIGGHDDCIIDMVDDAKDPHSLQMMEAYKFSEKCATGLETKDDEIFSPLQALYRPGPAGVQHPYGPTTFECSHMLVHLACAVDKGEIPSVGGAFLVLLQNVTRNLQSNRETLKEAGVRMGLCVKTSAIHGKGLFRPPVESLADASSLWTDSNHDALPIVGLLVTQQDARRARHQDKKTMYVVNSCCTEFLCLIIRPETPAAYINHAYPDGDMEGQDPQRPIANMELVEKMVVVDGTNKGKVANFFVVLPHSYM